MPKFFMKLILIIGVVALFVIAAPASAASTNFISRITLSNPDALVGENLTITADLQKISQIKKTEIKIDDEVFTVCKAGKSKCAVSLGKFIEMDVGKHTFLIEVTLKKGAVFTSGGTYNVIADADKDEVLQFDEDIANGVDPWLTDWKAKNKFIPAKNNLSPALARLTAPTFEPRVGQKLALTAYAKNKSELLGMGVYIDEDAPFSGIGSNCVICSKTDYPANAGRWIGPFTEDDIGEHSYTVLMVGKNGQRRVARGTFEVRP